MLDQQPRCLTSPQTLYVGRPSSWLLLNSCIWTFSDSPSVAATAVQNTLCIKWVTFCVSPSGWLRKPSHPPALKRWPCSSLQVEPPPLGPIPLWTLRYNGGSEPITYWWLESLHHFCSMGQNSSGPTGCFFGLDPLVSMTRTRSLFFVGGFLGGGIILAIFFCSYISYISYMLLYLSVLSYSNWNTYSAKNKV